MPCFLATVVFALSVNGAWAVEDPSPQELVQSLDLDDECAEGGGACSLSALQLRGEKLSQVDLGTFSPSRGMRLYSRASNSGWAWDVRRVKFMLSSGEELKPGGSSGCVAIDSGSAEVPGYKVQNAFKDNNAWWGGRKTASGKFFIGVECQRPVAIASVHLEQFGKHVVKSVEIQELKDARWVTLATVQVSSHGALESLWQRSFGLRLVGVSTSSGSGWAWDVRRVKFMLSSGEELVPGGASGCVAIESGHVNVAGYEVGNAFKDSNSWWGGRKSSSGLMFIGIECVRPHPIASVKLEQFGSHHFRSVRLELKSGMGWSVLKTVHPYNGAMETVWVAPPGWRGMGLEELSAAAGGAAGLENIDS